VEVPLARIVTSVTEAADPRLAPYQNIRDKDLLRSGEFIVEGEVAVRVACTKHARFALQSVLLSSRFAALASELVDTWQSERQGPLPEFYTVPADAMNAICGFDIHRGVLACAKRAPPQVPNAGSDARKFGALVVVMVGISNHDNVGGIFRSAQAFGADHVLLDNTTCDPLYRKAIRVSSGATMTVPYTQMPAGEILPALTAMGFQCLTLTPSASLRLDQLPAQSPGLLTWRKIAIVVGTEGSGLPQAIIDQGLPVRIAMQRGFDSLNVVNAVTLALYELTRGAAQLV
jgi:tRNA G18 (ribose-2'-O)-methylase SpoU